MKKLYNNSYLVISLYLLFSFFIDILTNLTIGLSLSIGMILRGLLLLYLAVGILYKYRSKENIVTLLILGVVSSSYLIYHQTFKSLVYLFKYNFVLIAFLYLYNLYKNEDKKINRNILTISLLLYSFSIIIAWLTKTALNSYAVAKVGTVGWFNSANEISAIISIVLAYIFVNLQKRINLIEIFAIIVAIFATILIGTRLPLIVALLCILYIFIKKLIKDIKNKNINYTNLILFIIFLVVFGFKFKDTPLWKNFIIHIKYLNISNPFDIFKSFKLFDHFVFNRRLTFLLNLNNKMLSSSIMNKLFGLTYIKKTVEMDLFDVFYTYGVVGFIIFVLTFINIFKKATNRHDIHYLPLVIIIFTAFLSGHVLLSPNVILITLVIIMNTIYKKQRKKVLFASYNLDQGGIETALLNMCQNLSNQNYDIYVYLEKKEGIFLKDIQKNICLRSQKVFNLKFRLLSKTLNMFNKLKFLITNFKEYDFSCCFATYSLSSNFIARYSSNNTAIYIHGDYVKAYENDIKELNNFFNKRKLDKFKHIVFVSNESKDNFLSLYPRFIDKSIVINNFIDSKKYLELSEKEIKEVKPKGKKLFLYVGRINNKQKNLILMINAFKLAYEESKKIELWLIGSGPDEKIIKDLIKEHKLEKSIKLLGVKPNPYPYFKICDYVILTSNSEGFPMVYGEAITFKKPIITTVDVTDESIDIKNNLGYICKKDEKYIKDVIIKVISNKSINYPQIDIDKINQTKLDMINKIINK